MFRLNPGFLYGEADAMTALFLMKIGKDCFFELVRYILSVFRQWCERSPIGRRRRLIIIGCWLTLPFFCLPCR